VFQKAAEQQQRSSLDLNCKPVTGLKFDARRYGESGVKYQGQLQPEGLSEARAQNPSVRVGELELSEFEGLDANRS
jgi:hypothetical protein